MLTEEQHQELLKNQLEINNRNTSATENVLNKGIQQIERTAEILTDRGASHEQKVTALTFLYAEDPLNPTFDEYSTINSMVITGHAVEIGTYGGLQIGISAAGELS